jgi:hypothetical protein
MRDIFSFTSHLFLKNNQNKKTAREKGKILESLTKDGILKSIF